MRTTHDAQWYEDVIRARQVQDAALALIPDETRWTRSFDAVGSVLPCKVHSHRAQRFSVNGAIERAARNLFGETPVAERVALHVGQACSTYASRRWGNGWGPHSVNIRMGFPEVIEMLSAAEPTSVG